MTGIRALSGDGGVWQRSCKQCRKVPADCHNVGRHRGTIPLGGVRGVGGNRPGNADVWRDGNNRNPGRGSAALPYLPC